MLQVGQLVQVVDISDGMADVAHFLQVGQVLQTTPAYRHVTSVIAGTMFVVGFADGFKDGYWAEELAPITEE